MVRPKEEGEIETPIPEDYFEDYYHEVGQSSAYYSEVFDDENGLTREPIGFHHPKEMS